VSVPPNSPPHLGSPNLGSPNLGAVQIAAGSTVGPYVVERKLAQGGMSVLFLAHDSKLDRPVALKVIAEELATPATRARLLREARTLAAVDHPGIVRIYGAGEHEGTPWIAMELIRGTDLKRLLAERGAVPPMRALRWIVQATEALAAAHDLGVIHRDVKPSNLLLTHEDQIKVVDFGIAKRRVEGASGDILTTQGEVLGTPAYLSPEQLEHGLADERSDVWGLGCVLYELCVGAPPFGRSSSATTTAAILRDEPAFPANVNGAVVDVITACLRKSSFARVGSMRELSALARDALEQPNASLAPGASSSERLSVSERLSSTWSSRVPPPRQPSIPPSIPPSRPSSHPPGAPSRPPRPSTPPRRQSSGTLRAAVRGRVKGTAIRTGLLWYAQKYGPEVIAGVVERASADARALVRLDDPGFGIVASGWYDTPQVGELLTMLEEAAGIEDEEESIAYSNALASAIAKDNVSGVYRSLFRLITTPPMLEANAQRVWRTYVDEGTLIAQSPSKGELRFEVRSWTRHHAQLCRLIGYVIQHVLRAVGYDSLVLERTQCVSQGDVFCGFEGMYLPR
jgi:serine/threonine protein kinase